MSIRESNKKSIIGFIDNEIYIINRYLDNTQFKLSEIKELKDEIKLYDKCLKVLRNKKRFKLF